MLRRKGFTLVEIMLVVAIIGLLSAIAIPNFIKARSTAEKQICIGNLKTIQGATRVWAMDNNKAGTDTFDVTSLTPSYIKSWPKCRGKDYDVSKLTVDDDPTCPNIDTLTDHKL